MENNPCLVCIFPERFYRKNRNSTPDPLLEDRGIMHIHLGSPDTKELIYLVQYSNRIVILEISDHYHFNTDPIGAALAYYNTVLTKKEQERIKKVKSGILPRKSKDSED